MNAAITIPTFVDWSKKGMAKARIAAAGIPPARKAEARYGNYAVAHVNFVVAYTKDNLAHVIYPGGITTQDWIHDLTLLINENWSRP